MNESLDLRNRILKMRESNNLVLDQVKSEAKDINTNLELINQKTRSNPNKVKEDLRDSKDKTNSNIQKENIRYSEENEKRVDTNLFRKKTINSNIKPEKNRESLNSLSYDNEAQFRIIANKFNEAVEVILELSEKVKKLEETVNNLPVDYINYKKKQSFLNIKTYGYIIVTVTLVMGIYTFPIDLSLVKIIIIDIISSILK